MWSREPHRLHSVMAAKDFQQRASVNNLFPTLPLRSLKVK